ncbi:MAG TPA: hypothetical protein VGF39_04060 [Stellaceae bacterium]|jgi:hypothetical protein
MALHASTFVEYITPTQSQSDVMDDMRARFADFVTYLDGVLPDGPDKTYVLRQLRDCAMWSNVTVLRTADGTPRT